MVEFIEIECVTEREPYPGAGTEIPWVAHNFPLIAEVGGIEMVEEFTAIDWDDKNADPKSRLRINGEWFFSRQPHEVLLKLVLDAQKRESDRFMPWNVPPLDQWDIVGMNHYHLGLDGKKVRALFVAMTKGTRCIQVESEDEARVWKRLRELALKVGAEEK